MTEPGPRRLRPLPRISGRAVLPRKPAQPDPQGNDWIQAIDLLGRKVRLADGAGLRLLLGRILAISNAGPPGLRTEATQLMTAAHRLADVTATLWADGDPAAAFANVAVYLERPGTWSSPGSGLSGCWLPRNGRTASSTASGQPLGRSSRLAR